ncbi:hypothetical protein M8C21_032617, partial [Ambrosia artemisiifolia]
FHRIEENHSTSVN